MFAILSSLIRVYSICHSQQSDQGQHCLPFSAVWSGSTLLAILSRIRIYTILTSQKSDEGLHYLPFFLSNIIKVSTVCHSQQSDQGLQYLPFSAVWSGSFCHSQSYKGLHCLPFSVWSGSTMFPILSSLIRVYTTCHSEQWDQGLCLHCHSQE